MTSLTYALFAAALLPLFLIPGWLLLRRVGLDPLTSVYCGLGATVAYAGAVVGLAQLLPWSVRASCIGALVFLLAVSLWCAVSAPRPLLPEGRDLAGVAIFCVAFVGVAAFSAIPSRPWASWPASSVGPERIETARWPGGYVDNVLPFRTGQVALHKLGGDQIRDGFSPGWWVTDRTPLTGLSFAFAAGALGVHVREDDPTRRPTAEVTMTVKDDYGFWSYQLTAMLLNLAIVLGVFLLAREWLGRREATIAALVAAVLPGVFIHTVYTWPKMVLAYFALAAAAAALRGRPVLAGALAALGYLCHPAGGLWVPAIAILLVVSRPAAARVWPALIRFAAAAGAVALPWLVYTTVIVGATSRLAYSPWGLSWNNVDPEEPGMAWDLAWDQWAANGLLHATWTRLEATANSLLPVDLTRPAVEVAPGSGFDESIGSIWSLAHGYSLWGMVGVFTFVPLVVAVARGWPRDRRLALALALPGFLVAFAWNGYPESFAQLSLSPLVGLFAVAAGAALAAWRTRTVAVIVALMAFEFLTLVYGVLYEPFNITAPAQAGFTVVSVTAHLALLAALAWAAGILTRRTSQTSSARRSRQSEVASVRLGL